MWHFYLGCVVWWKSYTESFHFVFFYASVTALQNGFFCRLHPAELYRSPPKSQSRSKLWVSSFWPSISSSNICDFARVVACEFLLFRGKMEIASMGSGSNVLCSRLVSCLRLLPTCFFEISQSSMTTHPNQPTDVPKCSKTEN